MSETQAMRWAREHGAADAVMFVLAVGCPVHGSEQMDVDTETLEAYCEGCE